MKTTKKRALYIIAALLAALFVLSCLVGFAACGGSTEPEPEPETPAVATVSTVSISGDASSMTEGDTATLTASVTMSDNSAYTGSYTWSTSDSTKVSISGTGASVTVKAEAAGSATITVAVSDSKSATYAITVSAAPVPTVTSVTMSDVAVAYGSTGTVTATVTMSSGSYSGSYAWSSSDTTIVTVASETTTTNSVTVTGVKCGTATISVKVGEGTANETASCTVTVSEDHTVAEAARVSAVNEDNKSDFTVDLGNGNNVVFDGSDIEIAFDASSKTYTLSGTSSHLSAEQLAALQLDGENDDHKGCEYIAFQVVANAGETIAITNYNGSTPTEGKTWTLYGADVSGESTTDGAFVLDTTDHIEGDFSMVLEVSYAGGDVETYKIVLGDIATEGHELVGTYASSTWTYACSVCEDAVELSESTLVKSLTLEAVDETSLRAAGLWGEVSLSVTPVIDVTTTGTNSDKITVNSDNIRIGGGDSPMDKDVVLNADIDMTTYTIIIRCACVMDLNGHTISRGESTSENGVVQVGTMDKVYGDLTLKDSSANESGKISGQYGVVVFGTVNSDGNVSKFTMVGGTVEGSLAAVSTNGQNKANGNTYDLGAEEIIIQGGTIKGEGVGIYLPNGSLTVTGGEISGKTGIEVKAGSATISGGEISTTVKDGATSVTENSNGASSSGYSIAVVYDSHYNAITSVSISGCTLGGTIYSDLIVDNQDNEVVTVATELGLVKDVYDADGVATSDTDEAAYYTYYIYRADCDKLGHDVVGHYDTTTQSWTYVCIECGEIISKEDVTSGEVLVHHVNMIADSAGALMSAVEENNFWNQYLI